jgi:hypothetical protein
VPPQHVVATAVGDGRYRATGIYTPLVGDWRIDVQLDRGPVARFPLTVAEEPPPLPKAAPKTVSAGTWFFGGVDTVLVAAILAGSLQVNRRLSRTRPGADAEVRALVDA